MAKSTVYKIKATMEVGARIPDGDGAVIPDKGKFSIKVLKRNKIVFTKDIDIDYKNYDIFDELGAYLLDLTERFENVETPNAGN